MKKIISVALTIILVLSLCSCAAPMQAGDGVVQSVAASTGVTGKKVYFAGPLFSQGEKEFNVRLTKVLENHGYEVYLPQRDGFEAAKLDGKSEEEKSRLIFDKDVSEIMAADILFMVLDGRVPDEGACVELGIGYSNNKRCYGVKSDTRSIELDLDINPMLYGCFTKIFKDYDGDKLVEEIDKYLSENDL